MNSLFKLILNDDIHVFEIDKYIHMNELIENVKFNNHFFRNVYGMFFHDDNIEMDILAYYGALNCLKELEKNITYSTVVCAALSQRFDCFTWCFTNIKYTEDKIVNMNNLLPIIDNLYSNLHLSHFNNIKDVVLAHKNNVELSILGIGIIP